jgi:hypothetical protein
MAAAPQQIWPLVTATIRGPTTVAYGPMLGGILQNPYAPADQGLAVPEVIYVDLTGPCAATQSPTNEPVQPGQLYNLPVGFTGQVSVNAPSLGHRISGIIIQSPPGFVAPSGAWPPSGPTTLQTLIPSYLYKQYDDDDDLQAMFMSFNSFAQLYVTWFATVMLPVIANNPNVNGALLDWVAFGLYGFLRPVLPSNFITLDIGTFNTYALDTLAFNEFDHIGPSQFYSVNDDLFCRILIWHLLKGDGKLFSIRWLKRRIIRFLTGTNGGLGNVDNSYQVSVTFGAGNQVNINLQTVHFISAKAGAIFDASAFDTFAFNELSQVQVYTTPQSPYVQAFKAAVISGVLELPFQFTYVVNIN